MLSQRRHSKSKYMTENAEKKPKTRRPLPRNTSSDAYILTHSKRGTTSDHSYARLAPALPQSFKPTVCRENADLLDKVLSHHRREFDRWLLELQEGFNLILYGYGSKAKILEEFSKRCNQLGDTILIDAWIADFELEHIIMSVGRERNLPSEKMMGEEMESSVCGMLNSIENSQVPLYLLINSLDAPCFSNDKGRNMFSRLLRTRTVKAICCVERSRTILDWNISEISGRRDWRTEQNLGSSGFVLPDSLHVSGGNFLWHDVTTFEPYDPELSRRDLKRPVQGYIKARHSTATFKPGSLISEAAASHILASVTERGRKLFQFIGRKQISRHIESSGKDESNPARQSMPYSATFSAARDAFLAYNDAQMKALLGEFTDHGLVVVDTEADSGSEVLWVSMLHASLQSVLQALEGNQLQ